MTDHLPPIVSFVGAIGAGKSTAAQYLVENYGYTKVSFAQPLKDMLKVLGLSDFQLWGDMKEVPCDELDGQTPRWAMQSLGTEWGRVCMGEDFWVNRVRQKIKYIVAQGGRVVLDDCRFENEDLTIRELGGIHIRIAKSHQERGQRLAQMAEAHASESYWVRAHLVFENDRDRNGIDHLHQQIDDFT